MCDDIFDDDGKEDRLVEQSWKKAIKEINKEGYREGLDAGKEEVLQEGFNQSFSVSSQLLYKIAELRGRISGKLSFNLMKAGHLDQKQESDLQNLLHDVVSLESDLIQSTKVNITDWLSNSNITSTVTQTGTENETIEPIFECDTKKACDCSCDRNDLTSMMNDHSCDKKDLSCNKTGCSCDGTNNKTDFSDEISQTVTSDEISQTVTREFKGKNSSIENVESRSKHSLSESDNADDNVKVGSDCITASNVDTKLRDFTKQLNSILSGSNTA